MNAKIIAGALVLLPTILSATTLYQFTSVDAPPLFDELTFTGIDNAGDVIGHFRCLSDACGGSGKRLGFIYANGQYSILSVPFAGGSQYATGINNVGQIDGFYDPNLGGGGFLLGYLFDAGSGTFTPIPNPPVTNGSSHFYGINDSGQMVGDYTLNTSHGFVYQSGTYSEISYAGAAPGTVQPRGINDAGTIVGYFGAAGSLASYGFVLQSGEFTVLQDPQALESQPFGTYAAGINSSGVVVGTFISTNTGAGHGFVYSNGSYSTLDFPGTVASTSLLGINDSGVIVGTYQDASGQLHGFVAAPVPEPTGFWTCSAIIVVLLIGGIRYRAQTATDFKP